MAVRVNQVQQLKNIHEFGIKHKNARFNGTQKDYFIKT